MATFLTEEHIQRIKELMAAMETHSINSLMVQTDDFTVRLGEQDAAPIPQQAPITSPLGTATAQDSGIPPTTLTPPTVGNTVNSPIVGTFYASSAPDQPAFVAVGTQVAIGDTLFIIESMKLMNEVTSEFAGTVSQILVKDGQGIEYGQPILVIE